MSPWDPGLSRAREEVRGAGKEDFEVVDLDAFVADDVRGRRLHSSQELTELPRGMLRSRLRLSSLSQGPHDPRVQGRSETAFTRLLLQPRYGSW